MSEKDAEVKTVLVEYECDVCERGTMVRDGNIVITRGPPLYPHKCSNCGHKQNFETQYPTIRYRKVTLDEI